MTLLDEVLEAHGGLEPWRSARSVSTVAHIGGLLPRTRMPRQFARGLVTIELAEPRTRLEPIPSDGRVAVFDRGQVRLESADGKAIESRGDPRPAFFGLSGLRRNLRWDMLDATYFAGYAWWNYLAAPLLLTRDDVEVTAGEDWQEPGFEGKWRRLEACFAAPVPTHSPRQTFYFDHQGLLRRHDYVAEIVGGWAHAAHYCDAHAEVGGLVFPTRRRVRPVGRRNRSLPAPTLVALGLSEITVKTG